MKDQQPSTRPAGAAPTKKHVVEASEVVLKDDKGNTRAVLGLSETGEPRLLFIGGDGVPSLEVGLATNHGRPGIFLGDVRGAPRAVLCILPDGSPSLNLGDGRGSPRVGLFVDGDGAAGLFLIDANLVRRVLLSSEIRPAAPGLVLCDSQGRERVFAHVRATGEGDIALLDPAHTPRVGMTEGFVAVYGPKGEVNQLTPGQENGGSAPPAGATE